MNIAFPTNFIVYAAVLPWPRAAQALRSWRPSLGSVPVPALIAAAAVTAFFFTTVGSPLLWLDFGLTSDLQPVDVLVVGSGIACVLMVSASMAWRYARSDQPAHT
jgi:hypothetical protein